MITRSSGMWERWPSFFSLCFSGGFGGKASRDAMSIATTIIETGLARYVTEPRGHHGLEGYGLGQTYRFERCEGEKGRYCRVYPGGSFPNYYETCGEASSLAILSRLR